MDKHKITNFRTLHEHLLKPRYFLTSIKEFSLVLMLLLISQPSLAAVDMFLHIDGVPGESTGQDHVGEIDVLAWSWGTSSSTSANLTRTCAQDLSLTKFVDLSSAPLLMGQVSGTVHPMAKLTIRTTGDIPIEYMVLMFTNFRVTSMSTGGSGGEDMLTENITFSFDEVSFMYTPTNSGGSAGNQETAVLVNSENC